MGKIKGVRKPTLVRPGQMEYKINKDRIFVRKDALKAVKELGKIKYVNRSGKFYDWLDKPRFSIKNVIYAIVLLLLLRYGFHHPRIDWRS